MFPGGQPDMAQLLQQAQQMQQDLAAAQEELSETEITGSAGGNLVTATMTGTGELTALTIAPAAVDLDDLETLQDPLVAAARPPSPPTPSRPCRTSWSPPSGPPSAPPTSSPRSRWARWPAGSAAAWA